MSGMAIQQLWTIDEVAALLRVDRTYVSRMISDGKLTAVIVGARKRIPQQAVAAYLDGKPAPRPSELLDALRQGRIDSADLSTDPPVPSLFADTPADDEES